MIRCNNFSEWNWRRDAIGAFQRSDFASGACELLSSCIPHNSDIFGKCVSDHTFISFLFGSVGSLSGLVGVLPFNFLL